MTDKKYMKQKKRETEKYTKQIKNPSNDFNKFLNDYFTGHPMIRGRLEEDMTVWDRLKDNELEIAKQMVFDNLGHDSAYIRAIGIFKDERGIPILKELVENLDNNFCFEKLSAAKILYDWIGYMPYLELLEMILPNSGSWTKIQLDYWINGIEKTLATSYIFLMLRDEDSFVRWCAYNTFKRYFHLGVIELHEQMSLRADEQKTLYEENKYYTDESVYSNKELFESRLKELKRKISNES